MKNFLVGLTILASISSFASKSGGTLKADHFTLKLSCLHDLEIKDCSQLGVVQTFSKTGEERVYDLPVGDTQTFKREFMSFLEDVYPKEGPNYKEEKESLTIAGKALVGWFRLPLAAVADKKYMKSIKVNIKNYAKYIDILSNPELHENVILEKNDSPLFYFKNRIEQFIKIKK